MKKIRKYIENSNLFFENLLEKINPKRINFNSIKQKAIDKILNSLTTMIEDYIYCQLKYLALLNRGMILQFS